MPTDEANTGHEWFLPEKNREQLTQIFTGLVNPVHIHVFTLPGVNDAFNDFLLRFCGDMAALSDKVILVPHDLNEDAARQWGVTHSPTVLVEPERYAIRFVGAPLGEEGRSFVEAVLLASKRDSGLSPASREQLAGLAEPRTVKVFVSPTCPYCPGQVVNAFRAAVERPGLVEARCVEIGQMADLAARFGVGSVPHTVFHDTLTVLGLEPEDRFVSELITLKSDQPDIFAAPHKPGDKTVVDLLIIGAGPAGLTAGIYAGRAGLKALILEKGVVGGQVALTPVVENYPGFATVAGVSLMEMVSAQARQYCQIVREETTSLSAWDGGVRARTANLDIEAKALLVATGATWKKLGVPGEEDYFGRGVNYCATCDGSLYKGRRALVVGGGNTALTDALYLKNLGVDVALVHRREQFRAEKHLQDSVARENIPLHLGFTVEAILGDVKATAIRLRNVATGETREIPTDGVFVAVGDVPNSAVAARLGCATDEAGFVQVDRGMRTNVPRVYAAGDVTGGVRQIVTAVGQGATAALAIFDDLTRRG